MKPKKNDDMTFVEDSARSNATVKDHHWITSISSKAIKNENLSTSLKKLPDQFHADKERYLDVHINNKFKIKDLTGAEPLDKSKEKANEYRVSKAGSVN